MGLIYFLKGITIGFLLAAPVGPLGVLCIRRTIAYGSKRGLIVGLSAAVADILFGIVAAFGVTLISDFIYNQQRWIRLVGGVVLIILGYHTLRSHSSTDTIKNGTNGTIRSFLSTFLLTLTNPMSVFAFIAVFASMGIKEITNNHIYAVFLIVGIFFGTMIWFGFLTSLVHIFRKRIDSGGIALVNKIAGSLLMLFGVIALCSGLFGF